MILLDDLWFPGGCRAVHRIGAGASTARCTGAAPRPICVSANLRISSTGLSRSAAGWLAQPMDASLDCPEHIYCRLKRPTPILYAYSPSVLPKPSDWGAGVHVTGYWFSDAEGNWPPQDDLLHFLDSGPPPVYVGFGSTVSDAPSRLARIAIHALEMAGTRGILGMDLGGVRKEELPSTIFPVSDIPHSWLFPRMAAIVHHGGAGTGAGLRSGVPNVVVPFTSDQPFWARRVHQLGAGPEPLPARCLTSERLAAAIRTASHHEEMRRASSLLSVRINAERGVDRAVEIILREL